MSYVDGFVVPVPQQNLAAYRTMARKAGKVWREHGALEYVECVADDVHPGKLTSFPQAVKLKDGEVVVFSWIVYRSRKDRDRVNKLVMADPRLAERALAGELDRERFVGLSTVEAMVALHERYHGRKPGSARTLDRPALGH